MKNHGNKTHGFGHKNSEYRAWLNMRNRCSNPNVDSYASHGAKGIKVCEEWQNSFESFLNYVGMRPSQSTSLGRIDNNKGYEPGNVRWETAKQQACNRSGMRLKLVTVDGITDSMLGHSKRLGISGTSFRRYVHAMGAQEAANKLRSNK